MPAIAATVSSRVGIEHPAVETHPVAPPRSERPRWRRAVAQVGARARLIDVARDARAIERSSSSDADRDAAPAEAAGDPEPLVVAADHDRAGIRRGAADRVASWRGPARLSSSSSSVSVGDAADEPCHPRPAHRAGQRLGTEPAAGDEPHDRPEAPRRGRPEKCRPGHRGLHARPQHRVAVDAADLPRAGPVRGTGTG